MMQGLIFANAAASAAIVIILLLRKFFKDKVFSKVFVLLWALVIIRLLVPFEFSSALSLYPSKSSDFAPIAENNVQIQWDTLPQYDKNAFLAGYEPSEKPAKSEAKISSAEVLFGVWLSGAVLVGGYFSLCHIRTAGKIKANSAPMEEIPEDFPRGKTRFLKSGKIASPLSFGIFRPVAVIPEDVSSEQLSFVLLHEHTHIKNRDAVLKAAAVFALSLHWFNPLVWVAVKYLDRDLERFCDERVLSVIGSEKAAQYANAILDFAERESLFASLSFFSAASLEERVISIMKNKTKRSHLPAVIAVFMATLLVMTACGTAPKPEKKPVSAGELSVKNDSVSEIIGDIAENSEDKTVIDTNTGETSSHHSENHHGEDHCVSSGEVSEGEITENSAEEELDAVKEQLAEAEAESKAGAIDKSLLDAVNFVWPCESTAVTALIGSYRGHSGIDIGFGYGLEIYAAADGVVVELEEKHTGYGNYLVIDHGNGIRTLYAHCREIFAELGEEVVAGQIIATTGATGNSTGPHLHFEVRIEEIYCDPLEYIAP